MKTRLCFAVFLLVVTTADAQDNVPAAVPPEIWQPEPGTTWQWQLTGTINTEYEVEMYNIDLFDSPQEVIDALHERNIVVICYFSAGTYEDWRPDAPDFPASVLGDVLEDWAGEWFLDIRQLEVLQPIMSARLDLAVEKGCDGVEPDNVDAYSNDSGFRLTYADQVAYNLWLAEAAHERGLSIGLKNDLEQIPDLIDHFDWALNEQCFEYDECELLLPFIEAGKAVFGVEYEIAPTEYCPLALEYGFSWLHKTYDLDEQPPNNCADLMETIS